MLINGVAVDMALFSDGVVSKYVMKDRRIDTSFTHNDTPYPFNYSGPTGVLEVYNNGTCRLVKFHSDDVKYTKRCFKMVEDLRYDLAASKFYSLERVANIIKEMKSVTHVSPNKSKGGVQKSTRT